MWPHVYILALPAAPSTREDELKQRIHGAQPVYPWRYRTMPALSTLSGYIQKYNGTLLTKSTQLCRFPLRQLFPLQVPIGCSYG